MKIELEEATTKQICSKLYHALDDLRKSLGLELNDIRKNKGDFPVSYRTLKYLENGELPLRQTTVTKLLDRFEIPYHVTQPKLFLGKNE